MLLLELLFLTELPDIFDFSLAFILSTPFISLVSFSLVTSMFGITDTSISDYANAAVASSRREPFPHDCS